MQNIKNKAFTLVELLVVITILAIISVVAYQNFGGAVDKAVSGRKISDVSTIETSLQQYKADKNYYPPTSIINTDNNKWGYNSGVTASPSNPIEVIYNGQEIQSVTYSRGGGKVYGINDGTTDWSTKQIGAKGIISIKTLGKRYLSKDLYDPEVGDIKVGTNKLLDSGVGRYIYATYKKSKDTGDWAKNYNGIDYNIAYTIKKANSDEYITKIVGSYDKESCYDNKTSCPETLIGSSTNVLTDGLPENGQSNTLNFGVPYAVTDFASN